MPSVSGDISRLTLSHPDGVTPVLVGEGALAAAEPELASWLAGRTAFVVTTARVWALHGDRLAPLSPLGGTVGDPRSGGRGERRRRSLPPSGCGTRCWRRGASATAGFWPSAAAAPAILAASPPAASCAASSSCRCRRRFSPRWTPRSAARPASTWRAARIPWASFITRAGWCPTPPCCPRCRARSCGPGWWRW